MKATFETGGAMRDAMQAVRTLGVSKNDSPDAPACRLVVPPGAATLEVLHLGEHAAMRMRMAVDAGEPGETMLPASAVRILCLAPQKGPVRIETTGDRVVITLGQAARLPGVTPVALQALLAHVRRHAA